MLYGNRSPADVLLKKEFDEFEKNHSDRFKAVYTVDQPDDSWHGLSGYITKDLIAEHLPKDANYKVLVCGPPSQMQAISGTKAQDGTQGDIAGALAQLGVPIEKVFKF